MTGGVPTELEQLTSLKVLSLADTRLTSVPAEIGQLLTSLQELYLQHNQLTSVPAGSRAAAALEELVLSSNQLTESVPAEIGQLTLRVRVRVRGRG